MKYTRQEAYAIAYDFCKRQYDIAVHYGDEQYKKIFGRALSESPTPEEYNAEEGVTDGK